MGGMRKIVLLAVLAAVCGAIVPITAPVASASTEPTCLISDGPHFTKAILCADLADVAGLHAGHGRYSPGTDTIVSTLTVTVEFQPDAGPPGQWRELARTTVIGVGNVQAYTRPVRPHPVGALRACATVSTNQSSYSPKVCSPT